MAVLANASALVVAHNYFSSSLMPSAQDVRVTRRLVDEGRVMAIPEHNHVVEI